MLSSLENLFLSDFNQSKVVTAIGTAFEYPDLTPTQRCLARDVFRKGFRQLLRAKGTEPRKIQ